MPVRYFCALTITGLMLAASPLLAHHSFAAEYDKSKSITFTGSLTKLDWRNPHVFFYLDVKDPTGKAVNWAFELAGSTGLVRQGWTRNSLKPGDNITVNGYPARDGSHLANALDVILADGRKVFAGSSVAETPAK